MVRPCPYRREEGRRPALRALCPTAFAWNVAVFWALFIAFCSTPARANSSIFDHAGSSCKLDSCSLSLFGLLTGIQDTVEFKGTATFNGGIGVTSNGTAATSGILKWTGGTVTANDIVDFSQPVVKSSSCTSGKNVCGSSGTLNSQSPSTTTKPVQAQATVDEAYTQFNTNLYNYLNGLTVNAGTLATNASINIESGGTGVRVYDFTSGAFNSGALTFGCGVSLTTKCDKTDLVVIKISTSSAVTFNGNIALAAASGLSSDQVIFYITSPAVTFLPSSGSTMNIAGDYFYYNPSAQVTFGQSTSTTKTFNLDGRQYGAATLFNTRSTVVQNDLGLYTPEPGTFGLLIGGGALLVFLRRRAGR